MSALLAVVPWLLALQYMHYNFRQDSQDPAGHSCNGCRSFRPRLGDRRDCRSWIKGAQTLTDIAIARIDGTLRLKAAERGKGLEYFTLVWNSLEGLVAIAAGLIAGSILLTGFGIDSLIEVTSGGALLWRMTAESDRERREKIERISLRIVGGCFLTLAVYVTYEAADKLIFRKLADRSVVGTHHASSLRNDNISEVFPSNGKLVTVTLSYS